MKKKNNLITRLLTFALTLIVLCICSIMPVYADGPFDAASDNTIIILSNASVMTQETYQAIFDYWDLAYEHNMSMGMRLLAIKASTMNSTTTYVNLYFCAPDSDGYYTALVLAGSGTQKCFLTIVDENATEVSGSCSGYMRSFGSVAISSSNYSSSLDLGYGNNYAYRTTTGIKFGGGVQSGEVWDVAVANYNALTTYISDMTTESPPIINITNIVYDPTFTLDLGSLFSSIMNAPRAIFEGAFGFELFGINIAETLISLIVVVVVIFIITKIRGG